MPADSAARWTGPSTAATPSLMFHLEVDEQHDRRVHPLSPAGKLQAIREGIQSLTDPHSLAESRLTRDVRVLKSAILAEEGELDPAVLATRLAALGYQVALRTALGGGEGTNCFRNLRNVFLIVYLDSPASATLRGNPNSAGPGGAAHRCQQQQQQQQPMRGSGFKCVSSYEQEEEAAEPLIVDCAFPEHFEISQSTALYAAVLRCLPREFIGPASRLKPLVELLAAEMLDAFHAQGLERPPWRQPRSMLSKWLPERSKVKDAQPSSAASSPSAAAATAPASGEPGSVSPTGSAVAPAAAGDGMDDASCPRQEANPTSAGQACSPKARCTLAFCTMCVSPPRAVASYLRAMAAAAPPELFCAHAPAPDTAAQGCELRGSSSPAGSQGAGPHALAQVPAPKLQRRRSLLSSSLAGQEDVAPGAVSRGQARGYGPHAPVVRMVRLRG